MARATVQGAFVAVAIASGLTGCSQGTDAQSGGAAVAYKVGTFERNNQAFVGLVLRDQQVVEIGPANAAFESGNASAPKLTAPADMKQLIVGYEPQWRERLAAIAKDVSTAKNPPAYAYALDTLKILPPVRPAVILNAGGNYVEHTEGIAAQQQRAGAAPEASARHGGLTVWPHATLSRKRRALSSSRMAAWRPR